MQYRITNANHDELYHYGVLGMHWGIRRYQNYDGTRISTGDPAVVKKTPGMASGRSLKTTVVGGQGGKATGTARVAAAAPSVMKRSTSDSSKDDSEPKKRSAIDVIAGPNVKKGKGKDNSSHAKEILNDLGNAAEGAGNAAQDMKRRDKKVQAANERQKAKQQKKASQMSDKELRDSINRIKMEREYTSLTTKEVETGYDKFQNIMHDVKDVAVTAGAITGLILSIIKIKQALGHSAIDSTKEKEELYHILDANDFSDDVVDHVLDLDLDYIIDYYDLDSDIIAHMIEDVEDDYLMHHGIKGMKWGVRRYQNYDGTRIGGGGSKASNSFRNSIVGGQGGKATGTARLATKVPDRTSKYKNADTQKAVDAWKKHDEVHWQEVDPARDEYFKARSKYGDNDPRTKKAQDKMMSAINKRDEYAKIAVDKFKNIPYDDIDDDVLRIGQHSGTWKFDVKVEDTDNYKGPTIQRWSSKKQDFEQYKFESTNPNVEILGDAPGGEIALRRRPKHSNPVADAKAAKKREQELAKSEIQDLKDAYRLTGDRSYLQAAKDRERKTRRR